MQIKNDHFLSPSHFFFFFTPDSISLFSLIYFYSSFSHCCIWYIEPPDSLRFLIRVYTYILTKKLPPSGNQMVVHLLTVARSQLVFHRFIFCKWLDCCWIKSARETDLNPLAAVTAALASSRAPFTPHGSRALDLSMFRRWDLVNKGSPLPPLLLLLLLFFYYDALPLDLNKACIGLH